MRFSLLQFKRHTVASWSLLLVAIVMAVCFSQNLGLSTSCPSASRVDITEQITSESQQTVSAECTSSEHLVNTFVANLEFAIPLFILALVILASLIKQSSSVPIVNQASNYHGVRRHLAFCTFQE
ncbi:hypothetical protein [Psychromonas sp. Urea-02u-13]|uniref:hypothetical protein n=1 Tax=Psychromonas sp. Urea-02u-13 TaxID=2058326 RepID=UPI000C31C642|nr:hypothetical protein [Psychromonas sp. Urea-02u-13]PKG37057.1 hypothetical protein CXF74_20895 [Psychromonas sp. Urea-02u-13]